jgi:hypothetical protein
MQGKEREIVNLDLIKVPFNGVNGFFYSCNNERFYGIVNHFCILNSLFIVCYF